MTDNALEFSRQSATIQTLTGRTEEVQRFFRRPVLLTGEPATLATPNGQACVLDCALLLMKMTERLTIQVTGGPASLSEELANVAQTAALRDVRIVSDALDLDGFDAILNVGMEVRADLPWTTVNSNGWTARVSSLQSRLSGECSQYNPIGALAAACLGVSEIVKRLLPVHPGRGELKDGFSFSFYDYTVEGDPGPALPSLETDLLLVGAGAIGNGIVHLLRNLPIRGSITIVDRQSYRAENLGTCLLIRRDDLLKPKAEALARLVGDNFKVEPFVGEIADFMGEKLGKSTRYPSVVLTALDDIDARRHVQTIWPDLVIDGAIGPLSCEVSLHPWGPNLSCLMCDFEHPPESAAKKESELTGLSEEAFADPLGVLTEEEVSKARAEKRPWLRERIGQQKCSILSEAEIERVSQQAHSEPFEPSVPFVACLSASMMVTELMRYIAQWPQAVETGFQFDVLVGPQMGIKKAHVRKETCMCVERRDLINRVRSSRTAQR